MRWWNETVALLADAVPGGVPTLAFLSVLLALLVGAAWYFWPRWLPWHWRWPGARRDRARRARQSGAPSRRWGRLRWRWRWRWRRRRRGERAEPALDLAPDELPDLPATVLALTADDLAAAGRFAEAVRERLRAIVRELVEREVIPWQPGWTVTELAAAAALARPALAAPLHTASAIFSDIWYGLRAATGGDDATMRAQADTVHQILAERPVGVGA